MMIFTHMVVSLLFGIVSVKLFPVLPMETITVVFLAGLLPDLDMIFEHRKTFHRPLQGFAAGMTFLVLYLFTNSLPALILAFAFYSLVLHCFLDILSNGKTAHPVKNPDDRAVYDHVRRKWFEPRRVVVDGSIGDVLILIFSGLIVVYFSPAGLFESLAIAAMLVGKLYSVAMLYMRDSLFGDYDRFSQLLQEMLNYGPELDKDRK